MRSSKCEASQDFFGESTLPHQGMEEKRHRDQNKAGEEGTTGKEEIRNPETHEAIPQTGCDEHHGKAPV